MKPTLTVPLEIKALSDREFEGHGSIFRNVDLGGDIVMPGAFKKTLAEHSKSGQLPQMFWMHDPSRVPGKWTEMREDGKGLFVKGVLADTDLGNEIHTLLKMEAVRGLSIGYVTRDWDDDDDGNRLIKEVDLWEVSVVSLPMNPKAQVQHVKSRLSALGEYVPSTVEVSEFKRELEQWLRRKGLSKSLAIKYASNVFGSDESGATLDSSRRDAGDAIEADPEVIAALEKATERELAGLIRLPTR